MRFIEISGNLTVPISNEETVVLEKIKGSKGPLPQSHLDERESELARRLVHRGVLDRTKIDGVSCLIYNELD